MASLRAKNGEIIYINGSHHFFSLHAREDFNEKAGLWNSSIWAFDPEKQEFPFSGLPTDEELRNYIVDILTMI